MSTIPRPELADTVLELLSRHQTIRQYDPTPIDDATIRRAVEAAQMAATSSNVQAYALLQVTDAGEREQLAELAGGQAQVREAGAFFVVCGDRLRHQYITERAGEPYNTMLEGFLVAVIDATLFAQNLVVAFESMGLGTCYIGGLRNQLPEVDAVLELPEHVYPLFGLCVGLPAADPGCKPRLAPEAVWHKGRFPSRETILEHVGSFDDVMLSYYEARTGTGRDWSTRIATAYREPKRTVLGRYFRDKGAVLD